MTDVVGAIKDSVLCNPVLGCGAELIADRAVVIKTFTISVVAEEIAAASCSVGVNVTSGGLEGNAGVIDTVLIELLPFCGAV